MIITEADFANLSLLDSAELRRLLVEAAMVSVYSTPPDLVTMYSRVLCTDLLTGTRLVLRLVYPGEEDTHAGWVSVLADGMALLGASVGQLIEYNAPDGSPRRLRIEAVLYQPEDDLRTNLIVHG